MRIRNLLYLLGFLFFFPAAIYAYGHYTVSSSVPADVYVDNEYRATISATQTLRLILPGPQSYVIGVRARDTGESHKESVTVGRDTNEHRDIRAFSEPRVASDTQMSKTEVTVYSGVPADVYIDNSLEASIDSTQPMSITLPGPRLYVFEVRAKGSNLIFRDEINILPASNLKREIRAFDGTPSSGASAAVNVAPVPVPQSGISREEMASEIKKATAQAKAEALSEEAARRKRDEKRKLSNKGIAHVVGVEANRKLPSSVKNMERIKLLIEALPSFKK